MNQKKEWVKELRALKRERKACQRAYTRQMAKLDQRIAILKGRLS
jgi:uncharacterized protein